MSDCLLHADMSGYGDVRTFHVILLSRWIDRDAMLMARMFCVSVVICL